MDEKVKETNTQDEVQAEQPEAIGKDQIDNGAAAKEDAPEPDVAKKEDTAGDAAETESNAETVEEESVTEAASETTPEAKEEAPAQEATEEAEEEKEQTAAKEEVAEEATKETEVKEETPRPEAKEAAAEKQPEPEIKEEKLPEEEKTATAEEAQPEEKPATEIPEFQAGDTIIVHYKIREGGKERVQQFQGVVLQRKGVAPTETFTVRKISNGIGVERIFPLASPFLDKIEVKKKGRVRRARIFYLRQRTGKSARIKERRG